MQQFRVIKQLGHFLKEVEEEREIFFIFQTSLLKVLILPTFFSLSNTPKTRFSEPRFSEPRLSEILNLMYKLQLPFSYFTIHSDSI